METPQVSLALGGEAQASALKTTEPRSNRHQRRVRDRFLRHGADRGRHALASYNRGLVKEGRPEAIVPIEPVSFAQAGKYGARRRRRLAARGWL